MGSADLIADTLDPRFKRDARQLPVASPRNPVPNGDPDVLHDIVHIAGPPDPREPRSDVTVDPINRDHDPVDLDDGFSRRRCASQRDVNVSDRLWFLCRLIRLGFNFHGFTALTVQIE
ncbi:hypothetical protein NCCP2145_38630 [Pseudarthrobacter sp. NCCP-2145]|nr:hypothetical protein NCCP2145_38630 [Pseudarthrobacter sp. NCCP-2145]